MNETMTKIKEVADVPEDLFGKKEECVDTIALLIDNMERLSHGMEYSQRKH